MLEKFRWLSELGGAVERLYVYGVGRPDPATSLRIEKATPDARDLWRITDNAKPISDVVFRGTWAKKQTEHWYATETLARCPACHSLHHVNMTGDPCSLFRDDPSPLIPSVVRKIDWPAQPCETCDVTSGYPAIHVCVRLLGPMVEMILSQLSGNGLLAIPDSPSVSGQVSPLNAPAVPRSDSHPEPPPPDGPTTNWKAFANDILSGDVNRVLKHLPPDMQSAASEAVVTPKPFRIGGYERADDPEFFESLPPHVRTAVMAKIHEREVVAHTAGVIAGQRGGEC